MLHSNHILILVQEKKKKREERTKGLQKKNGKRDYTHLQFHNAYSNGNSVLIFTLRFWFCQIVIQPFLLKLKDKSVIQIFGPTGNQKI